MSRVLCLVSFVVLAGPAAAADKPKTVKIELRWSEARPAPGVTEDKPFEVPCEAEKVYLHKTPVLANADIDSATLQDAGRGRFFLNALLKEAGKRKMAASMKGNAGKTLVTLVDGKVVAAMVVRAELEGAVPITGWFTRAEAERIAGGIR